MNTENAGQADTPDTEPPKNYRVAVLVAAGMMFFIPLALNFVWSLEWWIFAGALVLAIGTCIGFVNASRLHAPFSQAAHWAAMLGGSAIVAGGSMLAALGTAPFGP